MGLDPDSTGTLADIGGRGLTARQLAEECRRVDRANRVVGFRGAAEERVRAHLHDLHELERPGRLFAALRRAG